MYYELDTLDTREWDNFNNDIQTGKVIILFYMNGCPYCESMKNEWDMFVSKIKSSNRKVPIYRILNDVNDKVPYEILKHVSGYPTILSANHNKIGIMYPENLERNRDGFIKFYNEIENQTNNREKNGGKKKRRKKTHKKKNKKKTHKKKKMKKTHKKKKMKKTHKKKKMKKTHKK